jgi:protein-tyrosine-phosphatase
MPSGIMGREVARSLRDMIQNGAASPTHTASMSDMGAACVASAGTGAWDGAPASEGAYLVALEHGLDLSAHRARLLTRDLAASSEMVLTMARHHRARLEQLGVSKTAHLLGEFAGRQGAAAEVRDPFGGDLDGYRETFDELDGMLDAVVQRLDRERLGDRR